MKFKNINEIRKAIGDSTYENLLSHSEKAVFNALNVLDNRLAWGLYVALFEFIDKFLR